MIEEEEDEEFIKTTFEYGLITQDSKFWDDYEDMGEEELLKSKIVKVKIYKGKYQGKDAIFGVGFTFKNYYSGETRSFEHIGTEKFEIVEEFNFRDDDYLIGFHIRFRNEAEYISQIGFTSYYKGKILVGTEEGNDITVECNDGDNIIIGTCGCCSKKLDAMGVIYINKVKLLHLISNINEKLSIEQKEINKNIEEKIKTLEKQLNEEKKENKILQNKISYLKNLLNEVIQKNLNNINFEGLKISSGKDTNIKELKNEISDSFFKLIDNQEIICININSYDENIRTSIICKNSDIFEDLEKKFYKKYPEYSNLNCFFTINGKIIDKNKNLEENNIHNDDLIILREK